MSDEKHDAKSPQPASAREFRAVFGKFFAHIHESEEVAERESQVLQLIWRRIPMQTVQHAEAFKVLSRIRRGINFLGASMDESFWLPFCASFNDAAASEDWTFKQAAEIRDFIWKLQEWKKFGVLDDVMDRYDSHAKAVLRSYPERGSVNWDAVNAVDVLRFFWWRSTGRDGPAKALNPASVFAKYLTAGFDYLKVEGHPPSAFRAWVKHGKKFSIGHLDLARDR